VARVVFVGATPTVPTGVVAAAAVELLKLVL
jgi:hypothetical protein